jgi:hypothetical protein
LNNDAPTPGAEAEGDFSGDRAPAIKKERAVKAAHIATQKAAGRLRRRTRKRWWTNLFAGDNQLWNILAMAIAFLFFIVICILVAAIILGKGEFFLEACRPVYALIGTIIAFIIGQKTASSR